MEYAHTTARGRVRNDYNQHMADEAEVTVSAYLSNDVNLYKPAITFE